MIRYVSRYVSCIVSMYRRYVSYRIIDTIHETSVYAQKDTHTDRHTLSYIDIAPKNYRMCWLLLVWYLNCKLGNFLRHKLRALHLPIQIICVQQPYTLFSRAGTNTPSDEYDTYRDTGWRIRYVSRIHFFSEAKLGNG